MIVKVHKNQDGRAVVAICDNDLRGRLIEEGDAVLDLTTEFYDGEEMPAAGVSDLMRNANVLNLVGEKSIKLAIKEELLDGESIKTVDGVPHAQVVLSQE